MPETTHTMIEALNRVADQPITEYDQEEIDLWNKGRALAHVVNSPGWDVMCEMLRSYTAQETDRLLSIDPGDKDAVVSAHAVAFAARRIYTIFVEDVQQAVTASQRTPRIVKENLAKVSPVPPESLA